METKVETKTVEECQICYEKYTSQLRKPIECHACFQKCCSSCVTYYLLNTTYISLLNILNSVSKKPNPSTEYIKFIQLLNIIINKIK